jgi:hypothetical protein
MKNPNQGGSRFRIREARGADSEGFLECPHSTFQPFKPDYTPGAYPDAVLDPDTLQQGLPD